MKVQPGYKKKTNLKTPGSRSHIFAKFSTVMESFETLWDLAT